MTVFVQGMRRSGTTISYDLFCQDGAFDTFYEPLAEGKPKVGGGSGEQRVDVFESLRAARRTFLEQRGLQDLAPLLNHGAPRKADLEFERDLPALLRDYLRFLIEQSPDPLLKFTRMYRKVPVLHELDPEAHLVHVVRDPRAVAVSYLFGAGQKHRRRFLYKPRFFTQTRKTGHWAAHRIAARLFLEDEFRHLQDCPDFQRVMLVWKYVFRETYRAGRELFGDRYFLLRHEDLVRQPEATLERLYASLQRPLPGHVVDWARTRLRPPAEPFQSHDPAWTRAMAELSLGEELAQAGYTELAEALPERPRSTERAAQPARGRNPRRPRATQPRSKERRKARLALGPLRPAFLPRRIHAFCVGTAKSGTHSLHSMFRRHYRSRHEGDSETLIPFLAQLAHDRPAPSEVERFVREREERLRTEFHASHPQAGLLPELVRLYPDSRYLLPIRDCRSWLESWINHELGRDPVLPDWYDWRDLAFPRGPEPAPREEQLLADFGLRPLASYLRYWTRHNQLVLDVVPADRLLVLRTQEIGERVDEIAAFVGVPAWTLDRTRTHQFRRTVRIPLLDQLPEGYLDALVAEHCKELMERFHPER